MAAARVVEAKWCKQELGVGAKRLRDEDRSTAFAIFFDFFCEKFGGERKNT